jgi:hypothetical protein
MNDLQAASTWHGYAIASEPALKYALPPSGVVIINSFPPTQTANGYLDLNA